MLWVAAHQPKPLEGWRVKRVRHLQPLPLLLQNPHKNPGVWTTPPIPGKTGRLCYLSRVINVHTVIKQKCTNRRCHWICSTHKKDNFKWEDCLIFICSIENLGIACRGSREVWTYSWFSSSRTISRRSRTIFNSNSIRSIPRQCKPEIGPGSWKVLCLDVCWRLQLLKL